MSFLFINLFIGYLTLLIAFIVVVADKTHKNSDWFLENFAISESELKALHSTYIQLASHQEPLGHDFEKVIHENRWNLYES